jgi:hypothetical protein
MATNETNGANLGFESRLWKMAEGLGFSEKES